MCKYMRSQEKNTHRKDKFYGIASSSLRLTNSQNSEGMGPVAYSSIVIHRTFMERNGAHKSLDSFLFKKTHMLSYKDFVFLFLHGRAENIDRIFILFYLNIFCCFQHNPTCTFANCIFSSF